MLDFPLQDSERSVRARQDAATLQVPLVVQQQMYNKSAAGTYFSTRHATAENGADSVQLQP